MENVGWLLTGKGVGAVLGLTYIAIATRSLGPEAFGQFTLVLGTAQFVNALVAFQTWQTMVRFGMAHVGGASPVLGRLIAFCIALDLGGALAGCVLAAIGVFALGPLFGWTSELQRTALLFSFVTLLSIRSTAVGILRLNDQFARGAFADAVTPIVRLAGAVTVLLAGATVTRFLVAWAIAEIITAGTYWYLASRTPGWKLRGVGLKAAAAAPAEHPGLWHFVAITNFGGTLNAASRQLPLLLIGIVTGPAAAGAYRLAHQLGQSLGRLSDMFSRALFAELARVHSTGTPQQLGSLFRKSLKLLLGVGAAIAILLFLGGELIIQLIAGEAYAGAYPLLVVLGTAAAVDTIGVGFEPTLMATGRAATAFRLRILATLFLLILLAVLLPIMGPMGAALATLAASLFGIAMFGTTAWRSVHSRP